MKKKKIHSGAGKTKLIGSFEWERGKQRLISTSPPFVNAEFFAMHARAMALGFEGLISQLNSIGNAPAASVREELGAVREEIELHRDWAVFFEGLEKVQKDPIQLLSLSYNAFYSMFALVVTARDSADARALLFELMGFFLRDMQMQANLDEAHASAFAGLITEAAERLRICLEAKPGLFKGFTRTHPWIAGIIFHENSKENKQMAVDLELSADCLPGLLPSGGPGKPLDLSSPVNRLVFDVISYINKAVAEYKERSAERHPERFEIHSWLPEAAKLPPFSAETQELWRKIIWAVLCEQAGVDKLDKLGMEAFVNYAPVRDACNPREVRIDYPRGKRDPRYKKRRKSASVAFYDTKEKIDTSIDQLSGAVAARRAAQAKTEESSAKRPTK